MVPSHVEVLLALFGGGPSTRNLGVTALGEAAMSGLFSRLPEAHVLLFDVVSVKGCGVMETGRGQHSYERRGAVATRRVYRSDSWFQIRAALRHAPRLNAIATELARSTAILDVSGGDSFSDIYGHARYQAVTHPKRAAIEAGRPLILLPQTIGPFLDEQVRKDACRLLNAADLTWARDETSFALLQELKGSRFDPSRDRLGVDLAFGLEPRSIDETAWTPPIGPMIGINISGLNYFDDRRNAGYGFRLDYRRVVEHLVGRLLQRSDHHVVLIAHVLGRGGSESDELANQAIVDLFPAHQDRLSIAPTSIGAGQAKWLISRMDWFCGTRMHSCIAGLSSGVPTAGIAYSMKAEGVFASIGQAKSVFDARNLDTEDAVDAITEHFDHRAMIRDELQAAVPSNQARHAAQLDHTVARIRSSTLGRS